jgi:hypothetical protein
MVLGKLSDKSESQAPMLIRGYCIRGMPFGVGVVVMLHARFVAQARPCTLLTEISGTTVPGQSTVDPLLPCLICHVSLDDSGDIR